jgi:hypothetical protein
VRSRVSFAGSWAVLYDAIRLQAAGDPDFDVSVIERALQQLLLSGELEARTTPPNVSRADVLALAIRGLLRDGGVILTRTSTTGPGRYQLAERPPEEFAWSHEETLLVPSTLPVTIAAPLEEVLGGALDGLDWDAFVRLVAPDGLEGGYSAVPRRSSGEIGRVARDSGGDQVSSMVQVNATMVDPAAVTATARPTLRPIALGSGQIRQLWLADGTLDYLGKDRVRSLPVTTGGDEVLFPDRLDGTRYWYLPTLELVEPSPAEDPETAAFLFSFERVGVGSTGDAALSGTVRLTLRPGIPEPVRTQLAALHNPPAQPVEMLDLNIELSIPFIDSADNSSKRTPLRGTVDRSTGDIVVTFAVADRWVRLAYAALSLTESQAGERPSIRYSFRYESYRVTKGATIRPLNGLKQAMIPIDWNPGKASLRPLVFNAATGVLLAGATQIRFAPEEEPAGTKRATRGQARGGGPAAAARPAIALARPIAVARPFSAAAVRPIAETGINPVPLEIRPVLTDVIPQLDERVYVQQSMGVQGAADVEMPCDRFGPLYRQRVTTGWQSIGCQEAFRLGQAPAQLYQEIPALKTEWFRIYKCLPQPERFLVLPSVYHIARYPPGHERAYLPAAMVYAVLDPETVANNRYRFVATVEPDIPPFAMRALRASLSTYAPPASTELDLPTDVATQVELPSMPMASALAKPRFTVVGQGVQVVLECQIADALILRSAIEAGGVLGRLSFTLGDASHLESEVELLLSRIGGPWGVGPVSADRTGAGIQLTNHIDRSVDVSTLRLYTGVAAANEVAVGQRLEPLATASVGLGEGEVEVTAVYSIPPAAARSLEESRIYVEDVTTNVIFTCGINYAARGMADLEVYARLRGVGSEERVSLSNAVPRAGAAEFVVPLSAIVGAGGSSPAIEFRLVRVMTTGERVEKAWTECPGALVDIQWDQIA